MEKNPQFNGAEVAGASFYETFKQTIMNFFGMGESESQEIGIESKKEDAVSKPDLMIELQEVVMDTQNKYLCCGQDYGTTRCGI